MVGLLALLIAFLTATLILLIALIGHQIAPWFAKKITLRFCQMFLVQQTPMSRACSQAGSGAACGDGPRYSQLRRRGRRRLCFLPLQPCAVSPLAADAIAAPLETPIGAPLRH